MKDEDLGIFYFSFDNHVPTYILEFKIDKKKLNISFQFIFKIFNIHLNSILPLDRGNDLIFQIYAKGTFDN